MNSSLSHSHRAVSTLGVKVVSDPADDSVSVGMGWGEAGVMSAVVVVKVKRLEGSVVSEESGSKGRGDEPSRGVGEILCIPNGKE